MSDKVKKEVKTHIQQTVPMEIYVLMKTLSNFLNWAG